MAVRRRALRLPRPPGVGVRSRPGRRASARPPQAHAARLQAARPQRVREHAGRQRADGGPRHQGRQTLPGPRAQLQPRHHLQGRGGDGRGQAHDAEVQGEAQHAGHLRDEPVARRASARHRGLGRGGAARHRLAALRGPRRGRDHVRPRPLQVRHAGQARRRGGLRLGLLREQGAHPLLRQVRVVAGGALGRLLPRRGHGADAGRRASPVGAEAGRRGAGARRRHRHPRVQRGAHVPGPDAGRAEAVPAAADGGQPDADSHPRPPGARGQNQAAEARRRRRRRRRARRRRGGDGVRGAGGHRRQGAGARRDATRQDCAGHGDGRAARASPGRVCAPHPRRHGGGRRRGRLVLRRRGLATPGALGLRARPVVVQPQGLGAEPGQAFDLERGERSGRQAARPGAGGRPLVRGHAVRPGEKHPAGQLAASVRPPRCRAATPCATRTSDMTQAVQTYPILMCYLILYLYVGRSMRGPSAFPSALPAGRRGHSEAARACP